MCPSLDAPGAYKISHAAGYGLLYQLTGDEKYAEFGKQCFEKALAGVRDGRTDFWPMCFRSVTPIPRAASTHGATVGRTATSRWP